MKIVKDILVCIVFAAIVILIIYLSLVVRQLNQSLKGTENLGASIQQTVNDVDATVLIARGAVTNANLVLGRIEQASESWQEVSEKQTEYWESLKDKSLVTMNNLNELSESLNEIVGNTDRNINSVILPKTAEVIKSLGESLKSIDLAIQTASEATNRNLDDIHRTVSDPSILATLQATQGTVEATEQAMLHVKQSMAYVEDYLSPKNKSFWLRFVSFFVPKLTVKLN